MRLRDIAGYWAGYFNTDEEYYYRAFAVIGFLIGFSIGLTAGLLL